MYGYGSGGKHSGGTGKLLTSNSSPSFGTLPVITSQRIQYLNIPSQENRAPTNLNIESRSGEINLNFQTFSSPVNIRHRHNSEGGSSRKTESVDKPHHHVHTVTKPIIKEVREIIAPQRIIRQEVQSVHEKIAAQIAHVKPARPVLQRPIGGTSNKDNNGIITGPALSSSDGIDGSFDDSNQYAGLILRNDGELLNNEVNDRLSNFGRSPSLSPIGTSERFNSNGVRTMSVYNRADGGEARPN